MNPGDTIGHYRIIEPLGKGGMGEVFVAEDSRLNRRVALKILPHLFASDPGYRQRFEREAQAIAAINHPNIVTIYSVEEQDGRLFLTMELVVGRPLSESIPGRGLPLPHLLRIAIDVADALASAQQRGITHRDLKPANIIVAADGRAKVLDFGLAKFNEAGIAHAAEDVTRMASRELTGEGKIIGTVAYMSPEQAEGKPVDPRSDIFSFGVVLHEMATGRRPFRGDTNVSIISAIIKDAPPPVTASNPDLPADLARIVRRCLAKDTARRYQTAADLRNELEELKQDSESGIAARHPKAAARAWRLPVWIGSTVVLSLVVAGLWIFSRAGRSGATPGERDFVIQRFTRLTSTSTATLAALSRDGRYVVHVKIEDSKPSLWLRQTATTSDTRIVPPMPVRYDGLAFSPDGDYIYYSAYPSMSAGGIATLHRIPVLGGQPTPLVEDVDSAVSFSPDGTKFAFTRNVQARATAFLMIAEANGGGVRELANLKSPEKFQSETPSWSPDGKTILASGVMADVGVGVFAVDVETGTIRRVGDVWGFLRSVQWMPDGRSFLIDGIDRNGTGTTIQIWRIAYPSGRASRVTNDLNVYSGVSVSGDGRSIATVQMETSAGLAVAPLGGNAWRTVTPPSARADGASGLSLLPDGRLVYSAAASALPQLWIVNADGSGARQLTTLAAPVIAPQATADGRWVYFHTFVTAGICVFRIAPDGSGLEQVTREGDEAIPFPSPDGRTIYVTRRRSGRSTAARVNVDVGDRKPEAIYDGGFRVTSVSADGLQLLGNAWDGQNRRFVTAVLPAAGGRPRFVEGVRGDALWTKDGGVIYPVSSALPTGLFLTTTAGGVGRTITPSIADRLFYSSISHDGKLIAISQGKTASDVVLITSKQEPK